MAFAVHSLVLMWLLRCQSTVVAQCAPDEVFCTSGKCIPKAKRCDGNNDCDDRSDENCCVQNSNSGQEFVLGFMSNYEGKAELYLFLTSPTALDYSVNAPYHGIAQTGSLQPNELVTIHINGSLKMTTGITNNGILVTSSEDMTVYGLNQEKYTTDAFLGLPTYIQGHEYVVASYTELSQAYRSLLAVVGIHNNTQVTIHLSSEAFDGVQSHNASDSVTYHIHWMQTLQLEGKDLTGSRIVSNETIAVFSGHECANVPVDRRACDHLVEQIPPIATLGQQFVTVPLATRTAGDIFRAIASQDDTNVDVNNTRVAFSLNAGDFVEFKSPSTSHRFVNASAPILLVQFSLGSTTDGTVSDPFMLMIPPIKQYRSYYVVSTPASYPVNFTSHIAIVVPKGEEPGLQLDGQPVGLDHNISWNTVSALGAKQDYVGANIRINSGSHIVEHMKKVKFGLSVYGFARSDSYGYPGGLQLEARCKVQVTQDVDECAANNGRGPCQQICNNTIGSFQCSCMDGFGLLPNLTSCESTSQPCQCSNNGACLTDGKCQCLRGWQGPKCTEHVCANVNYCSGHGQCIGPNKCECDKDWTGLSCSESTCSLYTSCSKCSSSPSCGWCEGDGDGECMPGDGTNTNTDECKAWFFYHCVTVVNTTFQNVTGSFSTNIPILNCYDYLKSSCVKTDDVMGSEPWCQRRYQGCLAFYGCFRDTDLCSMNSEVEACKHFSEDECPRGVVPFSSSGGMSIGSMSTENTEGGQRYTYESDILDFGYHIYLATFENQSTWEDYGCYCPSALDNTHHSGPVDKKESVDEIDECCKRHELCYAKVAADGFDCQSANIRTIGINVDKGEDYRNKWESAMGFCETLYIRESNSINKTQKDCCMCDFMGADCFRKYHEKTKGVLWNHWLEPNRSSCSPHCGVAPKDCRCEPACSGNGVLIMEGNMTFCLCFPGWRGDCCDQVYCNCANEEGIDCYSHGVCLSSGENRMPGCDCKDGYKGRCCQQREGSSVSGEPHLSTADGTEYDYFGIGEFWYCRSHNNDFGVQIRFFKFKHTSFAGSVALKTGNVTTTIYAINDTKGEDTLPILRINGTLTTAGWHSYPRTYSMATGHVKLYVQPTRGNGSIVRYLFQFKTGASFTVEVLYSKMVGRQYIDTEFNPVDAFLGNTEGLCGLLDSNRNNDLMGPSGELFDNATDFAESWRVDLTVPNDGEGAWSWFYSNFHPDDPLDSSYDDPSHTPIYGTAQLNDTERATAEAECRALGLGGRLLQNCIIDRAVTGDATVIQQQAFQKGKCPNDCTNHGRCIDEACVCTDSWTGEDCSRGGCGTGECPTNSQCIDGFCKCNFGFVGENCTQATCEGRNNCTDPVHGLCAAPNVCQCNPGYTDENCSSDAVCSHNCSNRGICLGDEKCLCNFNWGSPSCDTQTCANAGFCSGRGTCRPDGKCQCDKGWTGSACNLFSCSSLNDCSGHGACVDVETCSCYAGYTGPDCNVPKSCPAVRDCSGHGVCIDERTCLCYNGFYGDACDKFDCSQGCFGRGTCVAPEVCSCIFGWTGLDCSKPSCEKLQFCSGRGRCVGVDRCQCDGGWSGTSCNQFDCSSRNRTGSCSNKGTCVGPGLCRCNPGSCGDDCQYPSVDECTVGIRETATNSSISQPSPCNQICTDTCLSYVCSCKPGYVLDNDSRTCSDIDECQTSHCEQHCNNTQGSFSCFCDAGYKLHPGKASCQDVDECKNNNPCQHNCTNGIGFFNCSCHDGYMLNEDGLHCSDIDECQTSHCEQHCNNTQGSFSCFCDAGYKLHPGKASCQDVDECKNNNPCQHNCTNGIGFFNCSCHDGYMLNEDGLHCSDIDECQTSHCEQHCNNTQGSFSCFCDAGYKLHPDRASCQDVDECKNNNPCQHNCTNGIGFYNCSCHDGYTLNEDGLHCSDIDECSEGFHNCSQNCNNVLGSFVCSCKDRFYLDDDRVSCHVVKNTSSALEIVLTNISEQEFWLQRDKFLDVVSVTIEEHCKMKPNHCGASKTDERNQFHTRLTSTTFFGHNNSVVVELYVFTTNSTSSGDREEIIPATEVNRAIIAQPGRLRLQDAGFHVADAVSSPSPSPSTPFPTTPIPSSDGLSEDVLITTIVGVVSVVSLLFIIAVIIYRRRSSSTKATQDEQTRETLETNEDQVRTVKSEVVFENPTYSIPTLPANNN